MDIEKEFLNALQVTIRYNYLKGIFIYHTLIHYLIHFEVESRPPFPPTFFPKL